MSRSLPLLLAGCSCFLLTCSSPSPSVHTLFTTPVAILSSLEDAPAEAVLLFDMGKNRIHVISASGELTASLAVTPPQGGWGGQEYRGYWLNPSEGVFIGEKGDRYFTLMIQHPAPQTYLVEPGPELGPGTIHLWDNTPVAFSPGITGFSLAGSFYALPPSPAVLPFRLSSRGFPILLPPATLAFWDPLTGGSSWSLNLSEPAGSFFVQPPWLVLLTPLSLHLYEMEAGGMRWRGSTPFELPVLGALVTGTTSPVLWVSTLSQGLIGYSLDEEQGRLCLLSSTDAGAQVGNLQFLDSGTLSNPALTILFPDDLECPGKTPTDLWTLTFMEPPSVWRSLTISPNTVLSDLPWGQEILPGDLFLPFQSSVSYAVAGTDPLSFTPPLTETTTGILIPRERFLVERRSRGELGLLPLGIPRAFQGITLRADPGSDPPTPLDRFLFASRSGALGIGGAVEVKGVALLKDQILAVLSREGTLTLFSREKGTVLKVLR